MTSAFFAKLSLRYVISKRRALKPAYHAFEYALGAPDGLLKIEMLSPVGKAAAQVQTMSQLLNFRMKLFSLREDAATLLLIVVLLEPPLLLQFLILPRPPTPLPLPHLLCTAGACHAASDDWQYALIHAVRRRSHLDRRRTYMVCCSVRVVL